MSVFKGIVLDDRKIREFIDEIVCRRVPYNRFTDDLDSDDVNSYQRLKLLLENKLIKTFPVMDESDYDLLMNDILARANPYRSSFSMSSVVSVLDPSRWEDIDVSSLN